MGYQIKNKVSVLRIDWKRTIKYLIEEKELSVEEAELCNSHERWKKFVEGFSVCFPIWRQIRKVKKYIACYLITYDF